MNKQTYIKLPNITVSDLQKVVDYLDENNIKYIEYFEEENKLEKALNEIEKYINEFPNIEYASIEEINGKRLSGKLIPVDDLLEIINKAKRKD